MAKHSTNLPIHVTLNAPTLIGKTPIALVNKMADLDDGNMTITVNGGNYVAANCVNQSKNTSYNVGGTTVSPSVGGDQEPGAPGGGGDA